MQVGVYETDFKIERDAREATNVELIRVTESNALLHDQLDKLMLEHGQCRAQLDATSDQSCTKSKVCGDCSTPRTRLRIPECWQGGHAQSVPNVVSGSGHIEKQLQLELELQE